MTLIVQKPKEIPPSLMVLFRSTLLTWPMHAWFWPPLITWNYLTGKKCPKPILRVEVDKQRKLNPGTLKLWDKVWHKCGISVQETSPESGYDQSHSWSSSGSCWRIIEGCGWSSANKAKKKAPPVHILYVWGASPRTSTCSTTWKNLLTLTFVCVDVDLDRALFNKHSKTWNKDALVVLNRSQHRFLK